MAARPLDVLVVGGGATGAGVALDAVQRGLRVGIVEREDWASGTSSRSSKMIHGGLRYLSTGDLRLVREALRERAATQRIARHLVRPLPFVLPVYGRGPVPRQRLKLEAGLTLYDSLGAARAGERHRWLGLDRLMSRMPGIATEALGQRLRGGLLYHDDSADDARLVLAAVRTAMLDGALACNGAEVMRLLEDDGRVRGAVVRSDVAAGVPGARGDEVEIEAGVVVDAAGVWADRLAPEEGAEAAARLVLQPSKGIHLAVRRDHVGVGACIAFFEQTGNSNVFVEPWDEDLAIVGTSDDPYDGDLATPRAEPAEIDTLLDRVNVFLREPLRREDVVATWAGLRPLVRFEDGGDGRASKDVSRRHLVVRSPGWVGVIGGKLTTWRAMGEDAVDAAIDDLPRERRRELGPSRSAVRPLDGCRPLPRPEEVEHLMARIGIDRQQARALLRRHGTRVVDIAALVDEDPSLAQRLHPGRPYIAAEVAWAARAEQARSVEDIVQRRTRLAIETRDGGDAAREHVAALLERWGAADAPAATA